MSPAPGDLVRDYYSFKASAETQNPCAEIALQRFTLGVCVYTNNALIAVIDETGQLHRVLALSVTQVSN